MTKKARIRIGIIAVIVCVMGFSDWSFADSNEEFMILGRSLNYIVSALAWLWVVFAKLAGEFLTNKWVYGEVLGLDVLLRKYWNVVKNFANFGLGFYFVYTIFRGLISTGKQSIATTLKNNLLWLVIAGVGIQASRFLTALLIDTSTITLAAAGALPSQIISNNPNIEKSVEKNLIKTFNATGASITKPIKLDLFGAGSKASEHLSIPKDDAKIDPPQTLTGLIDQMMPRADDVSGPLYYMGFSILSTINIPSVNSASVDGIKATIFNTIIQGGTTVIFAIEMLVLCVVALIRIFYLWMFIMVSPIAILLRCIGQSGEDKLKDTEFYKNITKHLNISTVLINVFKPTIIVLGLGLAVIFVSFMKETIMDFAGKSLDYRGVSFSSMEQGTSSMNEGDTKYTSVIDHNLFSFTLRNVGKTLLEFILSILTVILVYQIIKTAVTIGGKDDFIGKRINKFQEGVGDIIGSMPVLPVRGYDKEGAETTHYISANKILDIKNGEPTSELLNRTIQKYQGEVNDEYKKQNEIIDSWFSDKKTMVLESRYHNAIESSIGNATGLDRLRNQMNKIIEIGKKDEKDGGLKKDFGYGMVLNPSASDTYRQERFEEWLTHMKGRETEITTDEENAQTWINMINRWNKADESEKTLENMFSKDKNKEYERVRAYADLFGLNLTSYTWDALKDADFSVKRG